MSAPLKPVDTPSIVNQVDKSSFVEALSKKADAPSLAALEELLQKQLGSVQQALQLKAEASTVDQVWWLSPPILEGGKAPCCGGQDAAGQTEQPLLSSVYFSCGQSKSTDSSALDNDSIRNPCMHC